MLFDPSNDSNGLFGQRMMRSQMGVPNQGGPMAPKRNGQDPPPKGYGGSGLTDITPPGPAGGGNPVEFGGGGEIQEGLGFTPMGNPHGFNGDQMGGGFNPMPTPPPWKGKNPEDFGVTMEFGGPGAINPVGMGPQDLRNYYHPMPPPPPRPMPPPPPQGGGLWGQGNTGVVPPGVGWPRGDQADVHSQTPMPLPPKQVGGQSGYLGGPGNVPRGGLNPGVTPQGIHPELLRYLMQRRRG